MSTDAPVSRQLAGAPGEGAAFSFNRRPRRSRQSARRSLTIGVGALVLGIALWQALVLSHWVAAYSLPSPWSTAKEWWWLAKTGVLWHHIWATLREALSGFGLAFGVSLLIAYPLAKFELVASLLAPYIVLTQAMPILALAPVLTVWFGLGLLSKTLICAIVVFFPMLINFAVGLRGVDHTLVEAASTEGAGRFATLVFIELPLAAPTILAGVRMGLTLSMTGAIVAEFVSASAGLGYMMELARSEFDPQLLFSAALTMVTLAVIGYTAVNLLERLLITWD